MAKTEVKLPSLGDDAGEEATVSLVLKAVGEVVGEGEDFIEMITEKATFTVPSPVSGKVVSIAVGEDDVVKVGDVLGVVDVAD